jgi:protein SCO1/2
MLHPRVRLALTVTVLCTAAIVLVVTLSANSGVTGAEGQPSQLVNGFYGPSAPPSLPSVNFALHNQNGQAISLKQYQGQVVVLTFVYSTCQSTCPVVVSQIRGALNELPHRVPAIAVSVDPQQDTPSNVSAFLIKEDMLGQMEYLVGPRPTLEPIWRFFGIQPQIKVKSSNSDHSVLVELLDKSGKPRVGYTDVTQMDPDAIAHDIEKLQSEPLASPLPKRKQL